MTLEGEREGRMREMCGRYEEEMKKKVLVGRKGR